MIKEIQAKQLLSSSKSPDPWFGIKYNMNLYRGCSHQCIYCDSRSECYQIEDFTGTLVKTNALQLLPRELASKRVKGVIGTGSMNDPYAPIEKKYQLTRGALEVIEQFRFPVHILTKSDLVLRDLDFIKKINQHSQALVSFTITTSDDQLGKKVEPGAPLVSARFQTMQKLSEAGIPTGVLLMPVLPFLEDNWENIRQIIETAHQQGAAYILASFGMTQRKGQQEYYYQKLDELFPGVRLKHEQRFGNDYVCPAVNADMLSKKFYALCEDLGMLTKIPYYRPQPAEKQLSLF
jgi:DNA repair photolyase